METNRQSKQDMAYTTLPWQQDWREYQCQGPLSGSWSFKSKARTLTLLRIMETNTTPSCLLYFALILGPAKATLIQFKTPHASLSQVHCKMQALQGERAVPCSVYFLPWGDSYLGQSRSREGRNIKVDYERRMKSLRILERAHGKEQLWSPGDEEVAIIILHFHPTTTMLCDMKWTTVTLAVFRELRLHMSDYRETKSFSLLLSTVKTKELFLPILVKCANKGGGEGLTFY